MSLSASVIEAMAAAGCSLEQIVATAKAHERDGAEKQAEKREQNRIRQQNHRARNAASRVTNVTECDAPFPKKEIPPTPPKEKTTLSLSEAKASSISPRAELEKVLDAERAAAVVDHRQRISKPLTAYAAKKLAVKLGQWPDPNEAADEMVANGWQGFKPEWMQGRKRATAPPGKRPNASEALAEILSEQSHESIFSPSYRGDVEFLPPRRA